MAGMIKDVSSYELLHLPDDILSISLGNLPLENQISLRRACRRFQVIGDLLLSSLKRLNKVEMQSFSFDGRERLLKQMTLTNIRVVSLVSIELNEDLAKHLARYSPHLRTINVDGTCYNRSFEFVEEYLTTFKMVHPDKVPRLQVNNLIEIDDKVKYLLDRFPEWNVFLCIPICNLHRWLAYSRYIEAVVVSRHSHLISEDTELRNCQSTNTFPNLQKIIFTGITFDDCFSVRELIKISKEVVFNDLCIKNYTVISALEGVFLTKLQVNLNHYKSKKTKVLFLQFIGEYLKSYGGSLKFLKISSSQLDDSVDLVNILLDLRLKNLEFEIGNPSEKFSFLNRNLQVNYWSGPLTPLLNTFSNARNIVITTSANFDVFEWIAEIKSFCAKRLSHSINVSIHIESYSETAPVITVNGNNYVLTIPKVVGLNFILSPNNALFAFNLAEMSQMTDLRNKSLTFIRQFLGDKLPKGCRSTREICELFKSLVNE